MFGINADVKDVQVVLLLIISAQIALAAPLVSTKSETLLTIKITLDHMKREYPEICSQYEHKIEFETLKHLPNEIGQMKHFFNGIRIYAIELNKLGKDHRPIVPKEIMKFSKKLHMLARHIIYLKPIRNKKRISTYRPSADTNKLHQKIHKKRVEWKWAEDQSDVYTLGCQMFQKFRKYLEQERDFLIKHKKDRYSRQKIEKLRHLKNNKAVAINLKTTKFGYVTR